MTATREQLDEKLKILETQFQERAELMNRLLAIAPLAIETLKCHLSCGDDRVEILAAIAVVSVLGARKPRRSSRKTNDRAKKQTGT